MRGTRCALAHARGSGSVLPAGLVYCLADTSWLAGKPRCSEDLRAGYLERVGPTQTLGPLLSTEAPPGLLPAREQMAMSLGWHIVLACFGVAVPSMIYVVHRRGIVRNDPVALGLTHGGQGFGCVVRDRRRLRDRAQF
jgi:hypothetical protein